MYYTPEYNKYVKQINQIMKSLDYCVSDQDRVATVEQIYSFILKHATTIRTQIAKISDKHEKYVRFHKMLNVFIEQSYEIHNDAITMYIGDANTLTLCRKLERFARRTLLQYLNCKPDASQNTFWESPYVRRSPRLAAKTEPIYYFNPYLNVVPLRRSVRLATKPPVNYRE